MIVDRDDLENNLRLKDFADISKIKGEYWITSLERSDGRKIVNWISAEAHKICNLLIPRGAVLDNKECLIEDVELKVGEVIQLERNGFAKVMEWSRKVVFYNGYQIAFSNRISAADSSIILQAGCHGGEAGGNDLGANYAGIDALSGLSNAQAELVVSRMAT